MTTLIELCVVLAMEQPQDLLVNVNFLHMQLHEDTFNQQVNSLCRLWMIDDSLERGL